MKKEVEVPKNMLLSAVNGEAGVGEIQDKSTPTKAKG